MNTRKPVHSDIVLSSVYAKFQVHQSTHVMAVSSLRLPMLMAYVHTVEHGFVGESTYSFYDVKLLGVKLCIRCFFVHQSLAVRFKNT